MPELEEGIDKLKVKLNESEDYWNKTIEALSAKLNCSAKDVIPLQAEVISLRQQLSENIKNMSYELYKLMPKIKVFKKQRFEYYAGAQAPYATNSSERTKLVEWDLAMLDHQKDILDGHIEFLRESLRDMDNINFSIKNKIALYQLTDME
jgi:hypothetical protein